MYRFDCRIYQRPFRRPLGTHHGVWEHREGIILRLEDAIGRVGWGEIAPLPWFGSETLSAALCFCQQITNPITEETIWAIPDELPACQFAFESALENLRSGEYQEEKSLNFSYLLPTGLELFNNLPEILATANTFKWKIGLQSLEKELELLEKLRQQLPDGAKLRLDANGGLTMADACAWLTVADRGNMIEFIEQPLPPSQFQEMLTLSESFRTAIALDESTATLKQVEDCYQRGWRGLFVIKPSIMGSIRRFRTLWGQNPFDIVFSSVLETQIGRRSALRLAVECSRGDRALGFGVGQWFNEEIDDEATWLEKLWKIS
jgi:O-succinylbenzoate synthase